MATYSDVLRGKSRATGLRRRGEQFQGLAKEADSFVTAPGQVQQMGGMTAPTPQGVDWGNILQRGFGSYMAGKSDKQADEAELQSAELNQQFMRDAIGQDPEAQRLLQMAQAGVPGADRALADKVAPKRQPLATFTQFISQNPDLDDESAAAMGAEAGIGRDLSLGIVKAARAGTLRTEKLGIAKEQRALEGQLLRDENRLNLAAQLRPQTGRPGGPAAGLSPGERQLRGKLMAEADKELMSIGATTGKYEQVRATIERDNAFGAKSFVGELMGNSSIGIVSAAGKKLQSEGQLRLKDYVTGEVLKRMAMLGGNDSNEELNRITASLPSALNDKQAALAMLESLHDWEETTRLAIKLRRDDIQSGQWFGKEPSREDYYRMAKQMRKGGQQGNPQPAAPTVPFQGIPAEQMQGIEGLLDELNLQ